MRFEIPGRLPGLNEYVGAERANRYKAAKMKRDAQDAVEWSMRAAGRPPKLDGPVEVHITWVEKRQRNGQLRDLDNIRFAAKFVLDALVEAKVIPDDGPKVVRRLWDDFMFNSLNPRIIVEVLPYEEGRQVEFMPITGLERKSK